MAETWEIGDDGAAFPSCLPLCHVGGVTSYQCLAVHPERTFVAYAASTIVVLWDWNRDSRIYLQGHHLPVCSASFTRSGEVLLTSSRGTCPELIVWRLEDSFSLLSRAVFTAKGRDSSFLSSIRAVNNPLGGGLDFVSLVCDHESGAAEGLRLELWSVGAIVGEDSISTSLQHKHLTVIDSGEVAEEASGAGKGEASYESIATMLKTGTSNVTKPERRKRTATTASLEIVHESATVVTLIREQISIWKIIEESFQLVSQQSIYSARAVSMEGFNAIDIRPCRANGLIYVLYCGVPARMVVVDCEGYVVNDVEMNASKTNSATESKVYESLFHATALAVGSERVYIGTSTGGIHIFARDSLKWIGEVRYQHLLRQRLTASEGRGEGKRGSEASLTGWPVTSLQVAQGEEVLIARFLDHMLVTIDIGLNAITSFSVAHFAAIRSLAWRPRSSDVIGNSCWHARPAMFIDLTSTLSDGLSCRVSPSATSGSLATAHEKGPKSSKIRGLSVPLHASISVTALTFHPQKKWIAAGDNHGLLRVFDVDEETFASRLLHIVDTAIGRTAGEAGGRQREIIGLKFSPDGKYLTTVHTGHWAGVLDAENGFNAGVLLRHKGSWTGEHRLLPPSSPSDVAMIQWGNGADTYYTDKLNVVVCTAPRYLTRHVVYRGHTHDAALRLQANLEAKYKLDSPCVSFCLHASHDYVLAVTESGNILMYHLLTKELRGIIPTLVECSAGLGFADVDPSGLYLFYCFQSAITEGKEEVTRASVDNRTCSMLIYEVASGEFAGRVDRLPPVCSLRVSNDGGVVSVGCADGVFVTLGMDPEMHENIQVALTSMTSDDYFWRDRPLYISPFGPGDLASLGTTASTIGGGGGYREGFGALPESFLARTAPL